MRLGSGSRGGSATPEGGDAPLARSGESGIVTSGFDYGAIARATPGYVGADIVALAKEAAVCAVNRAFAQLFSAGDAPPAVTVAADSVGDTGVAPYADGGRSSRDDVAAWQRSTDALRATAPLTPEQMAGLCVSFDDFMAALPKVQPAATREGFATIPNVTWADVGALAKVRGDLEMAIVQPLLDPGLFARYGVSNAGVLLYGPPGCGECD